MVSGANNYSKIPHDRLGINLRKTETPKQTSVSPSKEAAGIAPGQETKIKQASTEHRGNDKSKVQGVKEISFTKEVAFGNVGSSQSVSKSSELSQVDLETENVSFLDAAAGLSQEGNSAFRMGDFEGALLFFEASNDFSENAVTGYNLGCCYQELGQMEDAKNAFDTAQGLEPLNLKLKQKIENRLSPFQ